jgi:ESS family glutamate:Na+ symporter
MLQLDFVNTLAMLVAAVIRNIDDVTGRLGSSQRVFDDLGAVSLSLFLVLPLMTLRLWELAGLALPTVVMLAGQVGFIALVCWPTFRLMGGDYDAAVMSGGPCGFMLGTTANAMPTWRRSSTATVRRRAPSSSPGA